MPKSEALSLPISLNDWLFKPIVLSQRRWLLYISSLMLANQTTIIVFCEFLFFFLIMVYCSADVSDRLWHSITKTGAWVSSFPLLVALLLGVPLLRPLSYFGSLSFATINLVAVNLLWPCFRYRFGRRGLLFFVGRVLDKWCLGLLWRYLLWWQAYRHVRHLKEGLAHFQRI